MFTDPKGRREFMKLSASGLSALSLSSLVNAGDSAGTAQPRLHHQPKAKSVIFLYMSGGVSHVDSFDPKPLLGKLHGQPMPMALERTQFDAVGTIMASPFKSARYGQSGLEMTDMFPQIAARADDLAIVRSMTANFSEHSQGNYFMHSGFPFLGYPSAGSWVVHGRGSENPNLPGYVVLQSKLASTPHGGVSMYGNAFLPATTGGSIFHIGRERAVPNIDPAMLKSEQRRALDFISKLDRGFADRVAAREAVLASIKNAETAYLMQAAVPELTDLSDESEATRELYGLNSKNKHKAEYGRQCMMARRLVERGVRFVELSCCSHNIGGGNGGNPWDQHSELKRGHGLMAEQVDGPIAALLIDLKRRGLLDETLLVFSGEFGRTPFSQGSDGRDHDPFGFSLWLAGGGIQGGRSHGATDEFGYKAVENIATVYDLWATVLHQLGIDHERLTFRWGGRDLRLTDVHGEVWRDLV
ncbi:MAG: hypothetical protein ACI8QC_001292 [Planctomycetota bacterium]|jgi:hypothetical protein